jgi:NADH-quinone oxidoreductase subunit K
MSIGLPFFLAVSGILFSIGLLGVLLRRSPLTILLSLEVMLNSVNLTLVAFSRQVGGSDGQVFALVVMGIAAAEVVVGLGLVVAMTRREMVLDTDELRSLSG